MRAVSGEPAAKTEEEKHCCKYKQQQVGPREITCYGPLDEDKEVTQKRAESEQEAHPERPVQTTCIHEKFNYHPQITRINLCNLWISSIRS